MQRASFSYDVLFKGQSHALSEHFTEHLLTTCPDCIYVLDLQGRQTIYRNRELHKTLGYQDHDLSHPDAAIPQQLLHPEDRLDPEVLLKTLRWLPDRCMHTEEFRLVGKDGRWRYFASRITPLERCESGEVTHVLGMITDISGQKWAEQRAEVALRAAEEASAAKSRFLAHMSHEIRTPLGGMLGTVQLLQTTPLSSEQVEYARTLHNSGESLLSIVNDVLDLSKIEAGKIEINERPVNLIKLVEEALATFAEKSASKGVSLSLRFDPQIISSTVGDPDRLRQVLINLLGNAVKFTDSGDVQLSVRSLAREAHQQHLRFEVMDTGVGVASEFKAHLFEKFAQAKGTSNHAGAGLGLVIAKQLVELMNGNVGYEERFGGGSVFWFELPLRHSNKEVADSINLTEKILSGRFVALLSDDDIASAGLYEQLEAWGATVATGDVFDDQPPSADIVIIDRRDDILQLPPRPAAARQVQRILTWPMNRRFKEALLLQEEGIVDLCLSQPVSLSRLFEFFKKSVTASHLSLVPTPTGPRDALGPPPLCQKITGAATIVVVDDNPDNRHVIVRMVEKCGHSCLSFPSGDSVLRYIENEASEMPALIFMDCQMPVLDGIETTRLARQLKRGAALPIVALTANVFSTNRDACLAAGMNDVLTKPIRMNEVRDCIEIWTRKLEG